MLCLLKRVDMDYIESFNLGPSLGSNPESIDVSHSEEHAPTALPTAHAGASDRVAAGQLLEKLELGTVQHHPRLPAKPVAHSFG